MIKGRWFHSNDPQSFGGCGLVGDFFMDSRGRQWNPLGVPEEDDRPWFALQPGRAAVPENLLRELPWDEYLRGFLPFPIEALPEFCIRAYQLGINPLPKIRDHLSGIGVEVRYFIRSQGTAFTSDGPCLSVWVEYDDSPWTERGENPRQVACRVDLQVGPDILWSAEA